VNDPSPNGFPRITRAAYNASGRTPLGGGLRGPFDSDVCEVDQVVRPSTACTSHAFEGLNTRSTHPARPTQPTRPSIPFVPACQKKIPSAHAANHNNNHNHIGFHKGWHEPEPREGRHRIYRPQRSDEPAAKEPPTPTHAWKDDPMGGPFRPPTRDTTGARWCRREPFRPAVVSSNAHFGDNVMFSLSPSGSRFTPSVAPLLSPHTELLAEPTLKKDRV